MNKEYPLIPICHFPWETFQFNYLSSVSDEVEAMRYESSLGLYRRKTLQRPSLSPFESAPSATNPPLKNLRQIASRFSGGINIFWTLVWGRDVKRPESPIAWKQETSTRFRIWISEHKVRGKQKTVNESTRAKINSEFSKSLLIHSLVTPGAGAGRRGRLQGRLVCESLMRKVDHQN